LTTFSNFVTVLLQTKTNLGGLMLDRVIINISSNKTIQQIDSFIRQLNLTGKYIEIKCSEPSVAALAISVMGNTNKVVIINGLVVKSFDSDYLFGDIVGWFADYTNILF
jgi:hypothetical protein